jgi:phage baseplate assembly protein W
MVRKIGLTFPIERTENGSLLLSYGEKDLTRDAIRSVILTKKRERLMRPRYGSRYSIFDNIEATEIAEDIASQVNANIKITTVPNDEGELIVKVSYEGKTIWQS